MSGILGIDTSNYTTSAALYDIKSGELIQKKQLLPVKDGELGLRQSDAVFHHTRQLPMIIENLFKCYDGTITAVAASERPSQMEGSYMPCFLAGMGAARQLAAVLGIPIYSYTHQQGHVAAAAFGANRPELLKQEFLAFHVSGGTTDVLLVRPDDSSVITCKRVAGSMDLKAGQLIDRVGLMLGLQFPAGPKLEELAVKSTERHHQRAVLKDGWCSLSGIENKCLKLHNQGTPAADVAMFCILSILSALEGMTEKLLSDYPDLPVLYSGGVMSNKIMRSILENRFGGLFSPQEFSSDNAAGIAFLASMQTERSSEKCG